MRLQLSKPDRWAELRDDLGEVTNGERRSAVRAFEAADQSSSVLERVYCLADEMVAIQVKAWSFDFPIPSEDRESIDKVPGADFDILSRACTERQNELFPSFGADGAPDPDSPTEPSSA